MTDIARVFISYAHSDEHQPAVLELANRLRSDGVEAWIDQYEQAPPAGWRAWMEEQLRQADFVLIVTSPSYRQRIESSGPMERGLGARYEGTLILDDLYEAGRWNVKYIPIVLFEKDSEHVPASLRSYQRYSLYHDGGYIRLLRHLTGQPEVVAPPLGETPKLTSRKRVGFGAEPKLTRETRSDTRSVPDEAVVGGSEEELWKDYRLGGDREEESVRGSSGPVTLGEPGSRGESVPPEDRPNPFDPWTPAVPPRFQGRESELGRLERGLETGFGVSVVGDGRIGKSSLLRTFQGRLASKGRIVRYLDGQGPEGASIADFVARVVRLPVAQVPQDADAAADVLAHWVDRVGQHDRPVLLIDELDSLPERFDPRFFERLRNLIGRLVLVVASRQEVDRLYDELGAASPFDNRLMLVRVGLPKEDAAAGVIRLGAGLLRESDPPKLRRWAGRHAHFLQLYARHLLDARAYGEEEEALDRFLDEASTRLRDLWRYLSTKEQEHLRALARGQDLRAPRTLIRRGILEKNGRPFGEVLETWLREEL